MCSRVKSFHSNFAADKYLTSEETLNKSSYQHPWELQTSHSEDTLSYYFLPHPSSRKNQDTLNLTFLQNLITLLTLESVPIVGCVVDIWPAGSCNARKTGLFSVSVSDHCPRAFDTTDSECGHYPWELSDLGNRLFTTAMSNPVLLVNFDQHTLKSVSSFKLQDVLVVNGYYLNRQCVFKSVNITGVLISP